jgi:alpha-galactosidase
MLRSGMMGWATIMLDTTAWSAEQHDAAKRAFALYKSRLRPLIRDAQLYHVSPRPDGIHWDAIQYWNPAQKKGVVFVFRGMTPDEPEHRFTLAGLNPQAHYQLHFEDGSAPDIAASGENLLTYGVTIHLKSPLSSELVFLQETASAAEGGK